jgi:LPS export ABC transporter protein LptC/lipopolysaccharide transport protein LptA
MRRAIRLIVAVCGIGFVVYVGLQLRPREPQIAAAPPAVVRTDAKAVAESTGGTNARFTKSNESFSIDYKRQVTYDDGSTKLFNLKIVAPERGSGGRTFTVTADEGKVGQKELDFEVNGHVELTASDGLIARTDHATYTENDGVVRTPGPATFTRGRVSGSGTGMTYDKNADVLWLLADAKVKVTADEHGEGAADVSSETAAFARREKNIHFERSVHIDRPGQVIETDDAVGFLSDDENHIQAVQLRGNSRVTTLKPEVGALQSLASHDMDLKYSESGESLQHALITGEAVMKLAGEAGTQPRQITAPIIDVTMAPDGATPTALLARDGVVLTFPPDANAPGRTIRSPSLNAKGEPGRGLTRAGFSGGVQFREQGAGIDRGADSGSLDVGLKPGLSTIEDARFTQKVKFIDGAMTAIAATGLYNLEKGTLDLSGSDPGAEVPHVVNEQVAVDGTRINVTLEGPRVRATGTPVKSVLQPPKTSDKPGEGDHMPGMLKQDQPVTVLANALDYDGAKSRSEYTGDARLFQGDTSIKASGIVLDDKTGDMTAKGPVTTTTVLEQTDNDGKKTRNRSTATAADFKYEDKDRRLTYTGKAHMNGPEGDMTAAKIVLYLKPSGDELERAESYDDVTLREQNRTTKGQRMIYTTVDEKYVITGLPVEIVDPCGSRTTGKTLTFVKSTDTITVDGSDQIRTQTKGGSGKCQ